MSSQPFSLPNEPKTFKNDGETDQNVNIVSLTFFVLIGPPEIIPVVLLASVLSLLLFLIILTILIVLLVKYQRRIGKYLKKESSKTETFLLFPNI